MKLRGPIGVSILFAVLIGLTWQTWTQPIIDHGRELNYPLRVLNGEQPYTEIHYLYTPFALYFNALLYKVFGVHMAVLHAAGMVCGLSILLLIYNISRRIMGEAESVVTAFATATLCGVMPNGNYILPYSFGSNYGLVFAFASLFLILKYLNEDNSQRVKTLLLAGLFIGLSFLSKQEIGLTAAGTGTAAILLNYIKENKRPGQAIKELVLLASPPIILTIIIFSYILTFASIDTLLNKNHILFSNTSPQLKYFNKYIGGLLDIPISVLYTFSGFGKVFAIAGGSALIGGLLSLRRYRKEAMILIKSGVFCILTGSFIWTNIIYEFHTSKEASPLSTSIIVIPVVIGYILWRKRSSLTQLSIVEQTLLVISVFGFLSIVRVMINIRSSGPYNPFFTPILYVIFGYLFFIYIPPKFTSISLLQKYIRYAAMFIVIVMTISVLNLTVKRLNEKRTFTLNYSRGSMRVEPEYGIPIDNAIKYIQQRTSPNDYVLVLPQGSLINFLSDRKFPIRQEVVLPGFLEAENENEFKEQIIKKRVRLILISNFQTPEFRDKTFGIQYNEQLLDWIRKHYRVTKIFGPETGRMPIYGMKDFFITVYESNAELMDTVVH